MKDLQIFIIPAIGSKFLEAESDVVGAEEQSTTKNALRDGEAETATTRVSTNVERGREGGREGRREGKRWCRGRVWGYLKSCGVPAKSYANWWWWEIRGVF